MITSKAFAVSRNIRLCFPNHVVSFYIKLFKTYVRPLIESNIVAFSPITLESIDLIEKVQKRYTKFLPGCYNLTYRERLHYLELESLEKRRIIIDLVYLYKIISGTESLNIHSFASFGNPVTWGHRYKLSVPKYKLNTRKYFFINRTISAWNDLPDYFF